MTTNDIIELTGLNVASAGIIAMPRNVTLLDMSHGIELLMKVLVAMSVVAFNVYKIREIRRNKRNKRT